MNVSEDKITYEDVLEAQRKLGEQLQSKGVLFYNPVIIERAIKEGFIRVDELNRMWTVSPNFPWLSGIEVFSSEYVGEDEGFIIDEGGLNVK
jgi:hypothetical protein